MLPHQMQNALVPPQPAPRDVSVASGVSLGWGEQKTSLGLGICEDAFYFRDP